MSCETWRLLKRYRFSRLFEPVLTLTPQPRSMQGRQAGRSISLPSRVRLYRSALSPHQLQLPVAATGCGIATAACATSGGVGSREGRNKRLDYTVSSTRWHCRRHDHMHTSAQSEILSLVVFVLTKRGELFVRRRSREQGHSTPCLTARNRSSHNAT